MIKNDRQYRITKAQAVEFERALGVAEKAPPARGIAPEIRQAQVAALKSQLDELRAELTEYDELRAGKPRVLELTSLDELPQALIRARIAAGLTQRDLADRLDLKEQQIQRYEATSYMSASLARIRDVAGALGVRIREELFLAGVDVSVDAVLKRLRRSGIDAAFVRHRLLPASAVEVLDEGEARASEHLGLRLAAVLGRVFGWSASMLFGERGPLAPMPALTVRFKVPANADGRRTAVLAVYARYLAGLVIQATDLAPRPVPTDAERVRADLLQASGELGLRACLEYAWGLGIAVVPLRDRGGFHGATWRLQGRNVIVLKQKTRSTARWIHDFLHELRHAGEDPSAPEFEAVDTEAAGDPLDAPEEIAATRFAADVALGGRAEALAETCLKEAGGAVERLKGIVPKVAQQAGVRPDVLANALAFRLAGEGVNWWGTATRLQPAGQDPWQEARDFLLDRLELSRLEAIDRAILLRALESE